MWAPALDGWRAWLRSADRPDTTIKLRMAQLRQFAAAHPRPWRVTADQLVSWIGRPDWSTETRRSHRAALRSFYGWATRAGLIEHDPSAELPSIKPAPPRPRPAPERVLTAALAGADDRTRLMILLAGRQGLRRGEIAQVHTRDLVEDLHGWSLIVHGKGRKDRTVPLHDDMAALLRHWRPEGGYLFPGGHKGHLAPYWVGRLIRRHLPDGWTAHTLRHRFATTAYAGSRDLLAVQTLLGHSRPETTQRYVLLPDDALRASLRWTA